MEFLLYPTTVKMLAAEIINVCDAYLSRKISHIELKSIIVHYANNYPRMLFNAQDLNPTVLNRIGKRLDPLSLENIHLKHFLYLKLLCFRAAALDMGPLVSMFHRASQGQLQLTLCGPLPKAG